MKKLFRTITLLMMTITLVLGLSGCNTETEDVVACLTDHRNLREWYGARYGDYGGEQDFAWSPGSDRLVFQSNTDDTYLLQLSPNDEDGYEDPVPLPSELNGSTASFSPDGTLVIVVGAIDYNFVIYTLDLSAGLNSQLTNSGDRSFAPKWSPSGSWIAYFESRDGNNDIFMIAPNGKQKVQLTHKKNLRDLSWHPNDMSLVYIDNRLGDVFRVNTQDKEVTRITETEYCEFDPTWSPDGQHLSFLSFYDGGGDVFVGDENGQNPRNLTQGIGDVKQYTWSPDSQRIAFNQIVSNSSDQYELEIYVINADGTNQTQLTATENEDESLPQWSPDGEKLAFLSYSHTDEKWYLNILFLAEDRSLKIPMNPSS